MNFFSKQFQTKSQSPKGSGTLQVPKIKTPEEKALIEAKTRKLNAEAAKDRAISASVYKSTLSTPRKSHK